MPEPSFWTLITGAGLAATGGLITQLFLNWKMKRDTKKALLIALTAELKVMREGFDTHIAGLRITLTRETRLPRPDAFNVSTVVFDANAGSLGNLRDSDLIVQLVEAYSTVHKLKRNAGRFSAFTNEQITRQSVLEHHTSATLAQLAVMQLHNRMTHGKDSGPRNIWGTEAETRTLTGLPDGLVTRDNIQIDHSYPPTQG